MKKTKLGIWLALALAVTFAFFAFWPTPRMVYVGGPILTLDADDRVVEALGVEGERIGAVGSEREVRAWAGSGARVIDLDGHALLPGFIDAHSHFPGSGIYSEVVDLNSPPIGEVERIDDIVARLHAKAREKATGEWVAGMGYDDTLLAEKRHPTRHDLDRVSTEHPVAILHISGHLAVANSLALKRMGFDASTPDPAGGRIRREADGREPTGVLEESAAMMLSQRRSEEHTV